MQGAIGQPGYLSRGEWTRIIRAEQSKTLRQNRQM
jgi:hypothetical protein